MGQKPAAAQAATVPPIYQPEIAADAIMWAADHHRREMQVGLPTVLAIEANKLAAGLIDRYLARNGYESQQTQEPVEPSRQDNLWEPLPGDRGAHGEFDDKASNFSPHLWMNTHRPLMALGLGVTAFALAAVIARKEV